MATYCIYFDMCVSHIQAEPLNTQEDMLTARRDEFQNSIERLTSWDGFLDALNRKKMVLTPWYATSSASVPCSLYCSVQRIISVLHVSGAHNIIIVTV